MLEWRSKRGWTHPQEDKVQRNNEQSCQSSCIWCCKTWQQYLYTSFLLSCLAKSCETLHGSLVRGLHNAVTVCHTHSFARTPQGCVVNLKTLTDQNIFLPVVNRNIKSLRYIHSISLGKGIWKKIQRLIWEILKGFKKKGLKVTHL